MFRRVAGAEGASAVDVVAGEVGFGVGLPGEVDGGRLLVVGCWLLVGDCYQAGWGGRGEGVAEGECGGGGGGAADLEGVAVELEGADSPGGVAVGVAEVGGLVDGAGGLVVGCWLLVVGWGCAEVDFGGFFAG